MSRCRTCPAAAAGSRFPLIAALGLIVLVGCSGRESAPPAGGSTTPGDASVRVEPALPLFELELEHESWHVRVEVPADQDWASGTWRLRVWHSFLQTVPRESGAPRPGSPYGGWLVQVDGDPEPELALWSRPMDGMRPGHLQLWDLQTGQLYPRSVPDFILPEGTSSPGEQISWDGKYFVREFRAGPGSIQHRWNPAEDGWQPVIE